MPFIAAFALASLLVLFLHTSESAETYQWTDKNGVVGFADSLEKVPSEYRKSAKRFQDNRSGKSPRTIPGAPESSDSVPSEDVLSQDPVYWRERILAAQEQLEQLKVQRQQAQQAYDNLLGRRNQHSNLVDARDVEQASSQISAVDQQLREKEREISAITEEARQAGVPSSALSQ